jgi:hypothetical protein
MKPGTCIHYTGLSLGAHGSDCCAKGVNYREAFDGRRDGIMLRMPCVQYRMVAADGRSTYIKAGAPCMRKEIDRRGEAMIPCEHFQEPTAEEVEADRRESDAFMNRTIAALKVASEWRVKPKPAQDRREVVECPICKGKLHLSQSSYNGHVHGKCETPNCVSWME